MPAITTGVGLISGLDYQSIVDKLMRIEARPRDMILTRIAGLDAQRTAYLDISARLTALLARVDVLTRPASFNAARAVSSNESTLTVSATAGAQPGSHTFLVRALALTHQSVSRGFQARSAPLPPGTLTIESALARVDRSTSLDQLNGHSGVQRGRFRITDSTGRSAVIDTTDMLTVGELLERINAAGVGVEAEARDDRLVLRDLAGGPGMLRVDELDGGGAAAALGFGPTRRVDSDRDGEIVGTSVLYIAAGTPLAALNDGLGIRHSRAGGDFLIKLGERGLAVDLGDTLKPETRLARLNRGTGVRLGQIRITARDGTIAELDLTGAATVQDVKSALEGAFGGGKIGVLLSGGRLVISDSSGVGSGPLKIEDVSGSAAADLGIAGQGATGRIEGRAVLTMDSVADVLAAINHAPGNEDENKRPWVEAALRDDGRGLTLRSLIPGAGALVLSVPPGGSDQVLRDLGLEAGEYADIGSGAVVRGGRLISGLETVLLRTLNGGAGLTGGRLRVAANGRAAEVDLTDAETLAEVVRRLRHAAQAAGLGIEVGYNAHGTALRLINTTGDTAIRVTDLEGDFAARTGLNRAGAVVRGVNLQRRYISETTALAALNGGRGVGLGTLRITNALGATATVDLTRGTVRTVQDVIERINETNLGVTARINATGDGLLLEDATGGSGPLRVEDVAGTSARDLNLARTAADRRIDGTFEYRLTITGGETLESLAARIGTETNLAVGAVLNDGTGTAPFRLSITARARGARGELLIDDGDAGLGLATLTRAQDARVLYGGVGGMLLTSSDGRFTDVVPGVTLTAASVSDQPVTVTVSRDFQSVLDALSGLAADYNSAVRRIKDVSGYDAKTEKGGVLLGESTVRIVEDRLFRAVSGPLNGAGSLQRLSQVGLTFEQGNTLTFDARKFQEAYAADPEAVLRLFTTEVTGAAARLKSEIERITGDKGLIPRRTDGLAEAKELMQGRVDAMNAQLERKRARLLRQFQAMESALSLMQTQQTALASLGNLWLGTGTTSAR